jgi:cytochrome c peroxidase
VSARAAALAVALAAALAATPACSRADGAVSGHDAGWTPEELEQLASLSPLPPPPPSPGNALADDDRAAALGQRLFFDRGLSEDGTRSCATCHDPDRYFTDGRARAVGRTVLARNTPSVITAAWFPFLGWDGRADSGWSQALAPLEDPREMAATRLAVARRVASAHRAEYEAVFGPLALGDAPTEGSEGVERAFANVGRALEAYERRLRPEPSPFDRYVAAVRSGDPTGGAHLSAAALRGLRQFLGEGQCVLCHHGPRLSDGEFHNLGLPEVDGARAEEREGRRHGLQALTASPFACGGRGAAACESLRYLDSASPALRGAYRTPSLRNVAETAPYMHGGQLPTLDSVIAFYRSTPRVPAVGHRDPVLALVSRRLVTGDLVAFLRSLTSPPPAARWRAPAMPAP